MIGGTWWSVARLLLSVAVLSSILFALLGYATLAAQLHNAIYFTCLLIAVALLLHRLIGDLLEEAAAPDTPSGRWVRHRLGLPSDATLRGQHLVMLLVDLVLLALLAVLIPAAWGVDTDAILNGAGQLIRGVRIGGVTISLGNIGMAILAFVVCILLARLIRRIVRDRVLPTVDAPMPLRQSIDAGLNYVGVIVAILIGIGALGIDFTNLAIVLGALSVGIGLGLQNIANNVISGVFLLVERPIKAGDWVSVSGHEGFVRRINIRATEIETFQRTHVLVPNSMFLQNPVVNRTYSDTSSRVEIKLTVGLGTDVAVMEGLLREAALGHPRVLRVPAPIVRFIQITTSGLDFELFVFVARLEDRLVVSNDLNKAILAKLIELKIVDPSPVPELRLRGVENASPAERPATGSRPMPPRRRRDEAPRRRARRHWPIVALFVLGVLAGVALWAYSPSLPAETLIARYANDRSKFIDVGGVRAHVREQGDPDGIPVVLIHGSMGSLHMWEGWARELSGKARLISVDLPGHGLTGAWPRDEYTIEAYADFVEVLVDTLNLDRFVLVGHSMGGAVAWTFAATRPDRVSQLILVDAAGYPRTAGDAPLPTRLARMPVVGDIGIYFKPERLVRRSLAEVYADPAMVTPERIQPLRRAAALPRQPRGHAAARPHPGAARPRAAQAARRADPDHLGRQGPLGADRRRLPLPERHQGRRARDLRGAGPQPDGRGPQGDGRRGRRLHQADHAAARPAAGAADRPDGPSVGLAGEGLARERGPLARSMNAGRRPALPLRLEQYHHLGEGGVGDGLDLGLGAVLDGMGDVDHRRVETQRFALRLDAVDEARGDDVHAGKAAAVEIMKVVQTARCAGASIA